MKKVGIVTITRGQNYGNRLQNYAVQEVLRQLGFTPETLVNTTKKGFPDRIRASKNRLTPTYLMKSVNSRLSKWLYLKNDSHGIISSAIWVKRNKKLITEICRKKVQTFENFNHTYIKTTNFSIHIDDLPKDQLNKSYDFFVTGSDQVWNPNYPQTSPIDFLTFAPKHKRIAFSPSFGISEIPVSRQDIYAKWLSGFKALSVREDKGAEIIRNLTGLKVPVLVDPTMLISREQWQNIARKPGYELDKPFILTYFLGNKIKVYNDFILKCARNRGCEVIDLNEIRATAYYATDPAEFLYLVEHAELVFTDSFHGSVLSTIHRTPFVVFDRVEAGLTMSSRIETLLNKFDLRHHHFNKQSEKINPFKQRFKDKKLQGLMQQEIERSHQYLKQHLRDL